MSGECGEEERHVENQDSIPQFLTSKHFPSLIATASVCAGEARNICTYCVCTVCACEQESVIYAGILNYFSIHLPRQEGSCSLPSHALVWLALVNRVCVCVCVGVGVCVCVSVGVWCVWCVCVCVCVCDWCLVCLCRWQGRVCQ